MSTCTNQPYCQRTGTCEIWGCIVAKNEHSEKLSNMTMILESSRKTRTEDGNLRRRVKKQQVKKTDWEHAGSQTRPKLLEP